MSDPPIFADIGEANFTFANTTWSTDVRTYLHSGQVEGSKFTACLSEMSIDTAPMPFCNFDGTNDFSQILTNLVNTAAAVIRNRVDSFINGGDMYNFDQKIEDFLNNVFSYVSMPWVLPGDKGLYIDGFFYDNIQSLNDQMVFKLDLQLRQNQETFNSTNCSNKLHSKFTEEGDFDVQVAINDCTVNELIFTLY